MSSSTCTRATAVSDVWLGIMTIETNPDLRTPQVPIRATSAASTAIERRYHAVTSHSSAGCSVLHPLSLELVSVE